MAKRKNLKVIVSTARKLDILKYKQVFEEDKGKGTEENQNKCVVININNHKIPLSLKSTLPPSCIKYFERIKLFVPKPRVFYLEKPTFDYIEKAVDTVLTIHQMAKGEGDIQVFLTGTQEIADFMERFDVTFLNPLTFIHRSSKQWQN